MTAALEGIGLVIPVETSMKDPSQFPFVLRTALFILTTVLMTVGTLGYMTFGAGTKSIILLNFEQTPIVNIVKVVLILGILFTYPLQIVPVFQLFEVWMAKREEKRKARQRITEQSTLQPEAAEDATENEDSDATAAAPEEEQLMTVDITSTTSQSTERREKFVTEPWKIMFRFSVVLGTAIIATCAGANFGLFQSLVGSMGASCLAYSAPAYFHVTVYGRTLSRGEKVKDWLIFAFGVVGAIVGTACTLLEFFEQRRAK